MKSITLFYSILFIFLHSNIVAQIHKSFCLSKNNYNLIWQDEFDGDRLDTTKWTYRFLGIRYDAENCKEAVTVKDGNLTINTYSKQDNKGILKNYTGMILCKDQFKYGYFEARIKLSTVQGMWSAFWVQSPTITLKPYNPETSGVEIDIMEHRKHDWDNKDISNIIGCALHWDGYEEDHKMIIKKSVRDDVKDDYHIYGMEWNEDGYYFYYDGQLINKWTESDAPISKVFQSIILSSEVRDGNWAGKIPQDGYGDIHTTNAKMIVDYVRVYESK